ncbi:MAG: hypothetical protein ACE5GM_09120 [bacterium]
MVWFLGCSHNTSTSPSYKLINRYKSVLQSSIRHGKIYKGLETLLLADIVYCSPQYQKAYRDVYFQNHNLSTPLEREEFDRENLTGDRYRFLVAVFSDHETWHELTTDNLGKGSIWTLSLINQAGETLKPLSITELDDISEYVKSSSQIHSPWRKYYEIDFLKKIPGRGLSFVNGPSFTLKISSLYGFMEFSWSEETDGKKEQKKI